jgi:hypothetical protein
METLFLAKKRRQRMGASQTPESVAVRLREQFAPSYLTLTSIIQGVALSALVIRVESVGELLDLSGWLLVATTLLSLLLIWHEYLMQALAYVWMPSLIDSLVPFAFLVVELFVAHFVYGNLRAWLLAASIAYAIGVVAARATLVQARRQSSDNQGVLRAVGSVLPARVALTASLAVLGFAAWALYDVLRLGQHPLAVALVALIAVATTLGSTVPYWNRVLAYARHERTGTAMESVR